MSSGEEAPTEGKMGSDFGRGGRRPALGEARANSDVWGRKALLTDGEQFRLLAESIQDVFWISTPGVTEQIYVSPVYETVWQRPLAEVLNEPRSFVKSIHPEDLASYRDAMETYHAQGNAYTCEYRIVRPDGSVRWILERGFPVADASGRVMLMAGVCTDVTERKEAERERDQILSLSPDLVCIAGMDGFFKYVNPAWEKFLGYSTEELLSRPFLDFIHPDDHVRNDAEVVSLSEGHKTVDFENRYVCKDGSIRHVLWTAAPVPEKEVMYCIGRDITARKEAEARLWESEERFRHLFSTMPSGVAIFEAIDGGEDFVFRDVNAALVRIERVDRGDVIGRRVTEVFPGVKELGVFDVFQRVWRTGRAEYFPAAIYHDERDPGTWRESWVYKLPSGLVVSVYNDVTERVRAEEALQERESYLRSLLDTLDDAVLTVEMPTRKILYVNRACTEVFGYSFEELLGHTTDVLYPSEAAFEMYGRSLQDALKRGQERVQGELELCRKDGAILTAEVRTTFLPNRGAPNAVISVVRDITGHKREERERARLEEQYRQAQKMEAVGQLTGGVAHDFNNLLQVIQAGTHVALEDLAAEHPARESLAAVAKASERAAQLVSQLMLFSQRKIMQPESLDLNEIVGALLKMLGRVIGEHISVTWLPGEGVGAIHGDRTMIEQVVMNLCVNARDAMAEGGKLTIETREVVVDDNYCATHQWARPGRYVLLSVSDSGCGMDEATLAHVFEPFFTTKEVGKGTGLGLATVYGIVKQHDGMIDALSELGVGSSFHVYLPVSEASPEALSHDAAEQAAAGGTETILLAEDDGMVRELGARVLRRAGYTVLCAANGSEAVALFREHMDTVAMAILDVIMPEMTGREAYECMRELRPDLKVLFASGYSEDSIDTNFVLQAGLTLLQKPFAPKALLGAVRAMLGQSEAQGM